MDKGFIRISISLWVAPVLFARKKNESLLMCIDYRQLNEMKINNKYPLRKIDDLVDQHQGLVIYLRLIFVRVITN